MELLIELVILVYFAFSWAAIYQTVTGCDVTGRIL